MPTEEELIDLAKNGDQSALSRLLYEYSDQLSRFIQQRLPQALQASVGVDDIKQEAFRAVFQGIEQFETRHEGAFYGWLRTVALNRIRDAVKAQNRKKRGGGISQVHAALAFGDESVNNLLDDIAGDDCTASQNVARKDAVQFLRVALEVLPEQYRDVLRLQFEDGLTYDEIGEKIGVTGSAVKGLLRRAKAKLQEELGDASAYLSSR